MHAQMPVPPYASTWLDGGDQKSNGNANAASRRGTLFKSVSEGSSTNPFLYNKWVTFYNPLDEPHNVEQNA